MVECLFTMELTDISKQTTSYPSSIDQVGLERVELPFQIQWGGGVQNILATVRAVVSLDKPTLRGIHMSRIYLTLHEFSKNHILTLTTLKKLLHQMIDLQKGISSKGRIRISWKGI